MDETEGMAEVSKTYSHVNTTELYQTCRSKGLSVPPDASRKELIEYLVGVREPPEEHNVFDGWRNGMMNFILDFWMQLRTQLKCPAQDLKKWTWRDKNSGIGSQVKRKKGLPVMNIACRTCPDTQIVACVLMNPDHEQLIDERRE